MPIYSILQGNTTRFSPRISEDATGRHAHQLHHHTVNQACPQAQTNSWVTHSIITPTKKKTNLDLKNTIYIYIYMQHRLRWGSRRRPPESNITINGNACMHACTYMCVLFGACQNQSRSSTSCPGGHRFYLPQCHILVYATSKPHVHIPIYSILQGNTISSSPRISEDATGRHIHQLHHPVQ